VFLDGEVFLVRAAGAPARRASSHADDDTALAAPMPATVVAIRVAPEQAVARGDVLITLEAMKMEIAIRAPRDGIVRALACREGDLVSPGVPLIELA
jgi:biotin carboxyl carrier protein